MPSVVASVLITAIGVGDGPTIGSDDRHVIGAHIAP